MSSGLARLPARKISEAVSVAHAGWHWPAFLCPASQSSLPNRHLASPVYVRNADSWFRLTSMASPKRHTLLYRKWLLLVGDNLD